MKKKSQNFLRVPMISIWIFGFVMFLSNSSCAQNTLKITVVPNFLEIPRVYRENTLITSEDFKKNIFDGIDEIVSKVGGFKLSFLDLNKEENMEFLLSLPVPNDPAKVNADFYLWGAFDERRGLLDLELVSVQTGRSLKDSIDLTQPFKNGIVIKILDVIRTMLSEDDKLRELITINADTVVDAYNSIVQYELSTIEGEDLRINVDYDGLHEYVQRVNFKSDRAKLPSRLTLASEDGHRIYLNFGPDMDINPAIDIATNFSPADNNDEFIKELIVKSQKQYELSFQFKWMNGSVNDVQIRPVINPYEPQTPVDS